MPTILIIDDNPAVATALDVLFSLHDIDTVGAETPGEGLTRLRQGDIDLVIQDMNFHADTTSSEEVVALFHEIRARFPDLPVILLTSLTHPEAAVDLVKAGAADYLPQHAAGQKLMATVNNMLKPRQPNPGLSRSPPGEPQRPTALHADNHLPRH